MQTFDLSAHYPLLQAFDLTGRRVFGDAWTGFEAWTQWADDPAPSLNGKAALGRELAKFGRSMAALDASINYSVDAEQRKLAQAEFIDLSKKKRLAEDRFRHFPASYDGWIVQHDAFKRRCKVEALMMGAFGSSDLKVYYLGGTEMPWENWRHRPGFRVYINLSLVRVPRRERHSTGTIQLSPDSTIASESRHLGPSRYAAFVQVGEFEQWSRKFKYAPDVSEALTLEEQCRVLLKRWVTDHFGKPLKKQDCWRDLKTRLPDLTKLHSSVFGRWRHQTVGVFPFEKLEGKTVRQGHRFAAPSEIYLSSI